MTQTAIGIELGSTRIKAVLTDASGNVLASGAYTWENKFEGGYWTYGLEEVRVGLQACFSALKADAARVGASAVRPGAIGISAMMHGYLAFDGDGNLFVPFRTWRNNTAAAAAQKLTERFGFPVPARWSVAHLYQAFCDKEPHVGKIAYLTTLAGYVHELLTGERVLGIGDASGMFPVRDGAYDKDLLARFDALTEHGLPPLVTMLPRIRKACERAGTLTEAGARLLDPSGELRAGIPFCPPEGDAGTGMVATNSIAPGTGNISAGTSIFGMIVLDRLPSRVYRELDLVVTPLGDPVAMAHCNNCTSDLNAWFGLLGEAIALCGGNADRLYETLFTASLDAAPDCGGLTVYPFVSAETIAGVDAGVPAVFRTRDAKPTLADFVRAQIYGAFATLASGLGLLRKEGVAIRKLTAHGGLFKTRGVAQRYLAAALGAPVSVLATAGEGGAWGMALLALTVARGETDLAAFLQNVVFAGAAETVETPDPVLEKGFAAFAERFEAGLPAVRAAEGPLGGTVC